MNNETAVPKDKRVVTCPRCQQRLRLPQHVRTLGVTCTACRHAFDLAPESAQDKYPDWLIGAGAVGTLVVILGLVCGGLALRSTSPEQKRQQRIAEVTTILNQNRQRIFNSLHPTGTASQIVVHDAEVSAGPAGEQLLRIRYTLYWRGPVTTNGFTTVLHHFDLESQRPRSTEILATNGITNEQTTQLSLEFLQGFLEGLAK